MGYLRSKWKEMGLCVRPRGCSSLLGTGGPASLVARFPRLRRFPLKDLQGQNFTPRGEVLQGGGRKAASLFHYSFPTTGINVSCTASCLIAQPASETS